MLDLSLDRSDMLGWLADYPAQLRRLYPPGLAAGRRAAASDTLFTGILVLGTGGGSAAAAYVAAALGRSRFAVPLAVGQGYDLPRYATGPAAGGHLVVAVSHSGQTEETLSAYGQLDPAARARTVVIAGGGRLAEEARRAGAPVVELPTGMQARAVFPGILAALLGIVDGAGLGSRESGQCCAANGPGGLSDEVEEAAALAGELAAAWGPSGSGAAGGSASPGAAKPGSGPTPLGLAGRLAERLILIYGGPGATEGIARRWKNQLAENGKTLAHWYTVPEAHHDEVVGWDAPPAIRERLFAVLLRDPAAETARLRKRLDVTAGLLRDKVLSPDRVVEVAASGRGPLARAVSLCLFGDYLSCYVALLRGIDPTPVPIIVSLKEEMARG